MSAERSVSVGGAAGPGARAAVGRSRVAWRFGQLARVAGVLGAAWAVGSGCAADVEAGDGGEATEVEAQRQDATGGEVSIFGFPFTAESRLLRSLTDLANYGEKRAGTTAGKKAGDYVKARFHWAGLSDVKLEEFSLNGFDVSSSSLSLTVTTPEGQTQALPIAGHQAFAYSGKGTVTNVEVVDVGTGTPAEYAAPVTGKVVLVKASQTFHRTSQLKLALERGAVAMISASSAPANLVQVGGVAPAELGLGPAPALSIGGVDGAAVKSAIAAGQTVRATLGVNAAIKTRKGRNVVGRLKRPGSKPNDPYILVGAHYDTWATGATDNGTGVAAMLEIA
ncbi:MAG: M28 family peptidase, partial [Polyangiaceae bacterium]|nr:M28 family peptidase [Polyangiaceae bacterium]